MSTARRRARPPGTPPAGGTSAPSDPLGPSDLTPPCVIAGWRLRRRTRCGHVLGASLAGQPGRLRWGLAWCLRPLPVDDRWRPGGAVTDHNACGLSVVCGSPRRACGQRKHQLTIGFASREGGIRTRGLSVPNAAQICAPAHVGMGSAASPGYSWHLERRSGRSWRRSPPSWRPRQRGSCWGEGFGG